MNEANCFICDQQLSGTDVDEVKKRGIASLIKSSDKRCDGKSAFLVGVNSLQVHSKCRKLYTNEKSINAFLKRPRECSTNQQIYSSSSSSSQQTFNFQEKCIFCGEDITTENKKPVGKRIRVYHIRNANTAKGIRDAGEEYGDDWSQEVLARIEGVNLHEVGAKYHQPCYSRFYLPRSTGNQPGRPMVASVTSAMDRIYQYLEENKEQCQFSLRELTSLVDEPPSDGTIKKKLKERYNDDIVITSLVGRTPIISFRNHEVLLESWYNNEKKQDEQNERLRIVEKAAAIVLEDISSKIYDTEYYPTPETFIDEAEKDIPDSLKLFLQKIILQMKRKSKEKFRRRYVAIAHSIIASARPKSFLSPLQVGLAAYVHSKFGSKSLVTVLSALGFCASYAEAETLQLSAVLHTENDVASGFMQFVADNADVNVNTLDGLGTFHSMGMIQCVTPKKDKLLSRGILRVTDNPPAMVVGTFGQVALQVFEKPMAPSELQTLKAAKISPSSLILPRTTDLLWLYGKANNIPRIGGWNGFMQQITSKNPYATSDVIPMPFINDSPSSYDTIYTTLLCAADTCKQSQQTTCIVTFDQPLYQKARDIVSSTVDPRLKHVVVRLGGFHLLMSFLGAIGYIMSGSGLKELLSLIYAPLSVDKMLTGHAYSRAVRAHLLTHLSLGRLIMQLIEFTEEERSELEENLMDFDDGACDLKTDNIVFQNITRKFQTVLEELETNGATAKLWVQYFKMVTLVKQFIEAERTGNWKLHLSTVQKMLPFFHASGHFHYALSGHLYTQDMLELETKMSPREYRKFVTDGFFTIRRSNRYWSGIWTDMTIEQTLMRGMKTKGGLTGGRGYTDSVLTKWTMGLPILQRVSQSLEEFVGFTSLTSEQHVDIRPSRQARDNDDVNKLLKWFSKHPPFQMVDALVSLSTGIVGGAEINCHEAQKIGLEGMEAIVGQTFDHIKFSRKKRVLPLSAVNSSIKISGDVVPIDPTLLYQRISFAKQSEDDLKQYLEYELSPFPLSLFDEVGMRKCKKSAMYTMFSPIPEISFTGDTCFVIDGGFLLHKVVWRKGAYFSSICNQYLGYVNKHYKGAVHIVFDGYPDDVSNKSTKNAERLRRSAKIKTSEILFDESMQATVTNEKFLANEKNKTRLISHLREKFQHAGISVLQNEEDADRLIISTALKLSSTHKTVVIVGEDVDLLILLNALASEPHKNVYLMKPGKGKIPQSIYSSRSVKDVSSLGQLLFYHAFTGCDTTSALFNQGKTKVSTLKNKHKELQAAMDAFKVTNADPDTIADAGEKVMVALYGGKYGDSLNHLRYESFRRSVTKSKFNIACLPPTKAAARQHSLRVYLQIQQWLGNSLPADLWGWKKGSNGLMPILTLQDPAPKKLLEFLHCKCTKGCGNRCGCRKAGFKCSEACYYCYGQSCENSRTLSTSESDNEDDYSITDVQQWRAQVTRVGQPLDTFSDSQDDIVSDEDNSEAEKAMEIAECDDEIPPTKGIIELNSPESITRKRVKIS